MRVVLFRSANSFLHGRVREAPIDAHDYGLVLLVAHDNALERTLRHLEPLIPSTSTWPTWRATSALRRPSAWWIWSSSRAPVLRPPPSEQAQARLPASAWR